MDNHSEAANPLTFLYQESRMAQIKKCCTCLKQSTSDVDYYKLDSDPTASNGLSLKEKLLFCVPEFVQVSLCIDSVYTIVVLFLLKVLGAYEGVAWICRCCYEGLSWCYYFRKMCLEILSKWQTVINDTESDAKEDQIDVDEMKLRVVVGDEIISEIISGDGVKYTLVEIENQEPSATKFQDTSLINEKNTTPEQLNSSEQPIRKKRKYKKRKSTVKLFRCDVCVKRYKNQYTLKKHHKSHDKINNNVANDPEETLISQQNYEQTQKKVCNYVDLISTAFQNLTVKETLLKPNSKQKTRKQEKGIPIKFPLKRLEDDIKNGLLREAVLNFKQNKFTATDCSQKSAHESFGISKMATFPEPKMTNNHSNLCFIAQDALQKDMTDYILSVLRKINPSATIDRNRKNTENPPYAHQYRGRLEERTVHSNEKTVVEKQRKRLVYLNHEVSQLMKKIRINISRGSKKRKPQLEDSRLNTQISGITQICQQQCNIQNSI